MKKYRFVREYEVLEDRYWYETQERLFFFWTYVSDSGSYNKDNAKAKYERISSGNRNRIEVIG